MSCVTTSPPKNSLSKNVRLRIFLNLTLQKREAFGIGVNEWVSLANAKEKISKTGLTLLLESLLYEVRTHFSKNRGTLPSHSPSHPLLARMTRQKS